jgi:putative protease
LGIKTILEWDITMTENVFQKCLETLKEIDLQLVDSLRVQDPGAAEYVFQNFSHPMQLVCEVGNRNLVGLQSFEEYFGQRLERIIISAELNKELIEKFVNGLKVETEILGLGPILLFYTPRNLLSPLTTINEEDLIEATGSSEESPHKGFPLRQNRHGTFMYHIKDQFLIPFMKDLKEMGLDYLRLDLSKTRTSDFEKIAQGTYEAHDYPGSLMKGFYRANKTDILFTKLKNHRLQDRDETYVGEVIDVLKGEALVLDLKKKLQIGTQLQLISTEGKHKVIEVKKLQNLNRENLKASSGLVLIDYKSGFTAKSQCYLT